METDPSKEYETVRLFPLRLSLTELIVTCVWLSVYSKAHSGKIERLLWAC